MSQMKAWGHNTGESYIQSTNDEIRNDGPQRLLRQQLLEEQQKEMMQAKYGEYLKSNFLGVSWKHEFSNTII